MKHGILRTNSSLTLHHPEPGPSRDEITQVQHPENGVEQRPTANNTAPGKIRSIDIRDQYLRKRFDERDTFLQSLKDEEQKKVEKELEYLKYVRHKLECKEREEMTKALRNSHKAWRKDIRENIHDLQQEVRGTKYQYSHMEEEYLEIIGRLGTQGSGRSVGAPPQTTNRPSSSVTDLAQAELDECFGINSYAMYFENKSESTHRPGRQKQNQTRPEIATWIGCNSDDERFGGNFPNQKMPVEQLLQSSGSPLKPKPDSKFIRYFHIPTNNMSWVEVMLRSPSDSFPIY